MSNNTILFQATTGNENFSDYGSTQVYAFYVYGNPKQEVHLYKAIDKNMISSLSPPNNMSASCNRAFSKVAGFWSTTNTKMPNDSYVKLFINQQKKNSRSVNTEIYKGCVMLHFDNEYANKRIEIDLLKTPQSTAEKLIFEGKFRILTTEEVMNIPGYQVNIMYKSTFAEYMLKPIMTVINTEANITAKKVKTTREVVNSKGEKVSVSTSERRRLLRGRTKKENN